MAATETIEAKPTKGKKGKKKGGATAKAKVKASKAAEEEELEKVPVKEPPTD